MSDARLTLVLPSLTPHVAFLSLLAEDPPAVGASRVEHAGRDFATFVRALEDESRGVRNAPRFGVEPGGQMGGGMPGGSYSFMVAACAIGERSPVTLEEI